MYQYPSDIAFSPTVKSLQEKHGSRQGYASMEAKGGWDTTVTPVLAEFLQNTDMFYLGTSNLDGQPYIQYRGGPMGFLKVIDQNTIGFADFGGNKQYISTGNLLDNPKAFIFLMDYENRRRIKIWGNAKIVDDPELLDSLADPSYPGKVERAVVFEIEAWSANCPNHIHQRIPRTKVENLVARLQARIVELEQQLAGEAPTAG